MVGVIVIVGVIEGVKVFVGVGVGDRPGVEVCEGVGVLVIASVGETGGDDGCVRKDFART